MAGLTNIQNEFLKMRLANNPEFKMDYFPNVITQGPVGPLHDVNILKGNPTSNVYFEESDYKPPLSYEEMIKAPQDTLEDPEYMEFLRTMRDSHKGTEFRDIPVDYDYPGSRINIRTSLEGEPFNQPGMIITGEGVEYYQDTGKPRNVTAGQTPAVYMKPEMVADYGTAAKAPRNEMVPTPEWYSQLYETDQPHVNQADINATVEGILGHEVGHGATMGIEPHKTETYPFRHAQGEDVYSERGIDSPYLMSQEASDIIGSGEHNVLGWDMHTAPHLYDQNELYNRVLDLERLKMLDPQNYKTHPMWDTYQSRALGKFNESINMGTYKNVPKRFRPKYDTYYEHVKPSIQKYLRSIGAGISPVNVRKQEAGMPQNLSFDTGGGNRSYQPTTRAQNVARTSSRVGPGGNVKAYGLARGGLMDIPLPGRSRDI